jgi:translocation and assembly module TamA
LSFGLGLALVLAGCGSFYGSESRNQALTDAAEKPRPVLQLEVDAPPPLHQLLGRHLSLARLNQQSRGDALSDSELRRLVALAPAEARALLETEGYFEADVQVELVPGAGPGAVPRVQVRARPGPRVVVGQVSLRLQGPAQAAAERGQPQALAARSALQEDWLLPAGQPFRDADWVRAKNAALTRFRAQAFVAAQWQQTQARVDVGSQRADLSGTLDSGPLYRAGAVQIQGLHHHDVQTVQNLANYQPGEPATEDFLLDFQERLQRSGLFERATVTVARQADDPAAVPVDVRLTERLLQDATVGVGISANVGPELTLEHVHRRPFGHAAIARNRIDIAQKRQRWEGEWSTHTLSGLYRNLVGATARRDRSDSDTVSSASLRLGRAQETGDISRLYYVEAARSLTRSEAGEDGASALAVHYHGIWRNVDDRLSPTRGQAWTGQIGAGQARSNPGGNGPFVRLYGRLDAYRPFGAWYGQARVELGQVQARGDVRVPESLNFRAGGDESVRGYAYRSLAPLEQGVVVSGKVLFTASVEMARPFLASQPGLMAAVFVDAGRAAQSWRELDPALGYGVGLRYGSPIGALKVDLAWGQEERRLRLHLTVGVPF